MSSIPGHRSKVAIYVQRWRTARQDMARVGDVVTRPAHNRKMPCSNQGPAIMPSKDINKRRQVSRAWMAARRAKFFNGKCCADCGSTERLELDHDNKATKIDHKIWSWSQDRQDAETAKCTVRCHNCHTKRHAQERMKHGRTRWEHGCRCEICWAAIRTCRRRWHDNKRKKLAAICR